jgi:hypothetical protein
MDSNTSARPNTKLPNLCHLTVNTGNVTACSAAERDVEAITRLRKVVKSGRGQVLGSRWNVQMVGGPIEGSCCFELRYDTFWIVSCYMAWAKEASLPTWDIVRQIGRGMGVNERLLKAPPKSLPWLGVVFMPDLLLGAVPPSVLMQAGEVEQMIAWTVLDLFEAPAAKAA